MPLRIVGAGLPRTGTMSLKVGLEQLLGGPCHHMTAIPGFPFNLGPDWDSALTGGKPDWHKVFADFHAAVDWPSALFWREISAAFPDAMVLLSVRDSADVWHGSLNSTILPLLRMPPPPQVKVVSPPERMFQKFTGRKNWDDAALLKSTHDRHNDEVRNTIPKSRLLEWRAKDGWEPICKRLNIPVPPTPFPHINKREEWLKGMPSGAPRGSAH